MIPLAYIIQWQHHAPWPLITQIEQDLVLSRAIVEIYKDSFLRENLAFRGGTALNKLFISPPSRYSEDIDLVQIKAGPIGPVLEGLRKKLNPWLGQPKWTQKEGRANLYYKFATEENTQQRMRVKIEINTREHFHHFDLVEVPFQIENPWYTGIASVMTYQIEELLATKFKALFQRKKGRDLFDLYITSKYFPNLSIDKIIESFYMYAKHERLSLGRAEFEQNLSLKMQDPVFLNDIHPLLKEGTSYSAQQAYEFACSELISQLKGEPWKDASKKV